MASAPGQAHSTTRRKSSSPPTAPGSVRSFRKMSLTPSAPIALGATGVLAAPSAEPFTPYVSAKSGAGAGFRQSRGLAVMGVRVAGNRPRNGRLATCCATKRPGCSIPTCQRRRTVPPWPTASTRWSGQRSHLRQHSRLPPVASRSFGSGYNGRHHQLKRPITGVSTGRLPYCVADRRQRFRCLHPK